MGGRKEKEMHVASRELIDRGFGKERKTNITERAEPFSFVISSSLAVAVAYSVPVISCTALYCFSS